MTVSAFTQLACPLDLTPLHAHGNSWQCEQGHSFDSARQGYVHLLPVQHKRSRDPGDSKSMVQARQAFLNSGFYQPVAQLISERLAEQQTIQPADSPFALLDAGCGEGYYLRQLTAQTDNSLHWSLLGLDISKWAIIAAAKQQKEVQWVVGSNARLPVLAESLDGVLCMFGFPVFPEFERVLKPGGLLLMVDPGPDHLKELRELIYPQLKEKGPEHARPTPGFQLRDDSRHRYQMTLSGADAIQQLLLMTPHLFKASAAGKARALALTELSVTVDVVLTVHHSATSKT